MEGSEVLLPTLGRALVLLAGAVFATRTAAEAPPPVKVSVEWGEVERVSRTTATLQVVVNPPLRRGSAIHDAAFRALRDLQADYVRFVPWLPYPRLAVAELEPPRDGPTSWVVFLNSRRVSWISPTKPNSEPRPTSKLF